MIISHFCFFIENYDFPIKLLTYFITRFTKVVLCSIMWRFMYVQEHLTWVFLLQPEQLELEIIHSSLTTKNATRYTCVATA